MKENLKYYCVAVILALFIPLATHATTTCAGDQKVLGFSKNLETIIWEEDIVAECAPTKAFHEYNFKTKQYRLLNAFGIEDSKEQLQESIDYKKHITQGLVPPKGISKSSCDFKDPEFMHKDHYLHQPNAKQFTKIYNNPSYQKLVVISQECNIGASGTPCKYQGFYVLKEESCK